MIKISAFARVFVRHLATREIPVNYSRISRFYSTKPASSESTRKLIAAQDSDTFGSLSINVQRPDDELQDEGDIKEEEFIKNPPKRSQKLGTKQYADMIKDHLNNKRIKEAMDVLEVRMLKEDRVKPENYIYNLLIDGCAKVGYSSKAFNLFTKMRQRGLKVTGATYTSLFNAAANAPWPLDCLNKANRLRQIIIEKSFEPNGSNYNAMIKAFGRGNDLKTAFLLVDEMQDKKLAIGVETFNFLLQACASDREYGFRHALLVWHKMYQRRLKPDIYSFNLMLRCVRDTALGDPETIEEVLQTILLSNSEEAPKDQERLEAHSIEQDCETGVQLVNQRKEVAVVDPRPNLLTPKPYLGNLVSLKEVKKPEDRLLLLGGFSGFTEVMKRFDVKPDLKTYTEFIEVIPSTGAAEKRLLAQLWKDEIKVDVDFFNVLMKKRAMRFDYEGSKEVLEMIRKVNLQPDIVTYGVLSLGCQTFEQANELMTEMRNNDVKMNIQILGAMLKSGCVNKQFDYVIDILYVIKEMRLKPEERILECVNILIKSCNILKKSDKSKLPENFRRDVTIFKKKFDKWKDEMGLKAFEIEETKKLLKTAPWEQFQTPQAEGYEDLKGQQKKKLKKLKRYIGKIRPKQEALEKE